MSVLTTIWTTAAVATLAVAPVLGASAAQADSTPAPGTGAPRLARACERVPHRIDRLEKLQTRFHAEASVKGSVAFLSARIDKARAEGRTDLVRLLTDRLAVRKDIDATLPDILAKLHDAQSVCASHPTTGAPAQASS